VTEVNELERSDLNSELTSRVFSFESVIHDLNRR